MNITGTQIIDAPRLAVWHALNDSDVLKHCLPGCESVERISPEEFRIVMLAAVGPLRARFNGMLRMTEADAPKSCVMIFEGQGGAMGFGKGTSSVTLNEAAAGTELFYSATAQIGGKLAQVGSRLIDSVARKMSDDFFSEFRRHFAAPDVPAVTEAPAVTGAPGEAAPTPNLSINPPAAADGPRVAPRHGGSAAPAPRANLVPASWLAYAVTLGAAIAIAAVRLVHQG
jgi:carbon monoxide dehydrogenase subunit G